VLPLLERLANAAQATGRTTSLIEILVMQSLALAALGNAREALACVERAITLAEPEGFIGVFVDAGPGMRALLRQAITRGVGGEYLRRVHAAFDVPVAAPAPAPSGNATAVATVLPFGQSLTGRELEILRLIAAGLRNQEIAEQLSISPATVKRHIANAYGKLDATHRTEALVRARELSLL
jgi:LuxR family maltose regulon positive regulatory protein